MKCKKGYNVKPLKSAAGYYIGTLDNVGFPNCRISSGYAGSEEEAVMLPLDRQIGCIENEFCNEGKGCFAYVER
mgnify:CR=1 FL=1